MRWSTRRCQEAESLFGLREWSAARREILALLLGRRLLRLARPASLAIPSQAKDHEPTANCWACPRVRGLRRAPMTELSASESTRLTADSGTRPTIGSWFVILCLRWNGE